MEIFFGVILIVGGVMLIVAILTAMNRAAKNKGRRGWLWILMSFVFGFIGMALLLWSLPKKGEKPTTGQMFGRVGAIFVIIVTCSFQFMAGYQEETLRQQAISDHAADEYGFKGEDVDRHYKRMTVSEIQECVEIKADYDFLATRGEYNPQTDLVEFATQEEADIVNSLLDEYEGLECESRTYTYDDLDTAMRNITE